MNFLSNFFLAQNPLTDTPIHSFGEPIMESLRRGVTAFSCITRDCRNGRKEVGSSDSIVILRLPKVMERIGLSRINTYAMGDKKHDLYDPSWPTSIRLNLRSVGWLSSEIDAWLVSRVVSSHGIAASNFIQYQLRGAAK